MLLVAPLRDRPPDAAAAQTALAGLERLHAVRSALPAVTHVDYSARVQTVDRTMNPDFHALIEEFGRKTGVPVLINTSFNVRGEPIVCTPVDAYRCFMGTAIDYLVIGSCLLDRAGQRMDHPLLAAGRDFAAD
jgi:carbamoyltransferase